MAINKIEKIFENQILELEKNGTNKGKEDIINKVLKPTEERGPRYLLKGYGAKNFIRMNSNSYLGMALRDKIIKAEEEATENFGAGPGAVRFINGTYSFHRDLEKTIARFHSREDAMIFSSAYMTTIGVLTSIITGETVVISDELNHNCIINAIKISRPLDKKVYKHLDYNELEQILKEFGGKAKRAVVVTDGIFSMRGDNADFSKIMEIADKYDDKYEENIIVVADDSHGVGAYGETGRGTEEYTGKKVDILIGTLGKAFGVNGGYATSSEKVIRYLKEKAITYIYSNPITVGEAAAAKAAIEMMESDKGKEILKHLRYLTKKFEKGVVDLGFEIIESDHPIVPLLIRDTKKTKKLVKFLKENGVLATGLAYPVVPKGDETIRFQINADMKEQDIDYVLGVLKKYKDNL